MDPKDLKRMLDALREAEVNEFSLETPEYKIQVKRGSTDVVQYLAAPVAPPLAALAVAAPAALLPATTNVTLAAASVTATNDVVTPTTPEPQKGNVVKAPIVGTFYGSSSPEAAAYVNVGTRVEVGQVLCIIEAMKLMNEIESEFSGVIREILFQNGQPVEYGQPLFIIE